MKKKESVSREKKKKRLLKKGILVVFEGIDGSGKTTQAIKLLEKIIRNGFEAVYFREPSDSSWGREIRRKASDIDSLSPEEELNLFQKDRRENVQKNLKPALEKNMVVLLDRFYFSTIAYQGARGIDPKMIKKINENFVPKPDLVFILDVSPKTGLKRIEDRKKKDVLFEQEEYLGKVSRIFKSFQEDYIVHLDGFLSETELSDRIERVVSALLKKYEI